MSGALFWFIHVVVPVASIIFVLASFGVALAAWCMWLFRRLTR